ncbi:hypothetical protein [Streptomyces soliscabiei]|uniref:hypothetical protein n=1 Tax=Streptomyces soliscabiei TaxID=588897 RepID=UPI0029A6001A|nr:hypothetical protein [Streptomyces sp. NY05-11A]MDX2683692.1 hypothetical protein [Streptomyces sp. NY05-11A]
MSGKNAQAVPAKRDTDTFRLIYRHLTGLEYDGIPRTNATWTEAGDKVLHPSGRARRWSYRPRLQRAAIRWVWTSLAGVEGYAAVLDPELGEAGLFTAAGLSTVWAGYRTSEAALTFVKRRRVIKPLAKALARPLENDPVNILRDLVVPSRPDRPDSVVTVPVPDGWHGDRKAVESIVAARLGGEWDAEWRLRQAPFTAVFTRSPEPPQMVKWAEIQGAIADSKEGEIVVGLNSRGKPVRGDFVREEPMWGLSIGSGGGKSVFLWSTAAQLIGQGAEIVGIDPKYVSLDPLVGIPGVTIYNDPRNVGQMWKAIADFRRELEDRFDAWTRDRSLEFPRKVLIIEEGNMFSDISKDYWREVKQKGDPASPPVWGDIAAILRMGRQANMNVIAVFQRMDDAATGGRGLRDSFGFRMLGRYTWQGWRMLVGTNPIPRSQKRRGRFIVVDGGEHTWIQAPYATEEEIRAYCLAAREAQGWSVTETVTSREAGMCDQERSEDAGRDVMAPALVLVKGDAQPPAPRYTLAAAAREGIVPLSADALRQAKRRPGFPPAGEDGKWSAEELREWFANRPSAKAAGE